MKTIDESACAFHFLLHLACEGDQCLRVAEIARIEGTTVDLATKILNALEIAGLVDRRRGVDDGYQLSRDSHSITLADLTAVLEQLTGGNGRL